MVPVSPCWNSISILPSVDFFNLMFCFVFSSVCISAHWYISADNYHAIWDGCDTGTRDTESTHSLNFFLFLSFLFVCFRAHPPWIWSIWKSLSNSSPGQQGASKLLTESIQRTSRSKWWTGTSNAEIVCCFLIQSDKNVRSENQWWRISRTLWWWTKQRTGLHWHLRQCQLKNKSIQIQLISFFWVASPDWLILSRCLGLGLHMWPIRFIALRQWCTSFVLRLAFMKSSCELSLSPATNMTSRWRWQRLSIPSFHRLLSQASLDLMQILIDTAWCCLRSCAERTVHTKTSRLVCRNLYFDLVVPKNQKQNSHIFSPCV